MKKNPLTLIIGAVLIVLFALLLFVYQVRTTQVAAVTTFSKPTLEVTNAGAYFKWPWPVQKVYYFDKRVQNFEDDFTEGLTADNNNLLTSVYVGWRITDPKAFMLRFPGGSVTDAQKKLKGLLGSSKNAIVGKHPRFGQHHSGQLQVLETKRHFENLSIKPIFDYPPERAQAKMEA